MGDKTRIDWADATWEPVSGCTKVSAGCKNCYAERLATGRLRRFYPDGFGAVRTHPERLDIPLHWRKPRRVFVCSRSDLFHEAVPNPFVDHVWREMILAPHHTFLILTKRPERMREFARQGWWLPNVWLGVSVEDQATADERVPLLLDTPAAVRFVSAEPLLAGLDLIPYLGGLHRKSMFVGRGLDLVIVGCESGKNARPMNEAWVRSIRDQCQAAGVRLFYKQRMTDGHLEHMPALDGKVWNEVHGGRH